MTPDAKDAPHCSFTSLIQNSFETRYEQWGASFASGVIFSFIRETIWSLVLRSLNNFGSYRKNSHCTGNWVNTHTSSGSIWIGRSEVVEVIAEPGKQENPRLKLSRWFVQDNEKQQDYNVSSLCPIWGSKTKVCWRWLLGNSHKSHNGKKYRKTLSVTENRENWNWYCIWWSFSRKNNMEP